MKVTEVSYSRLVSFGSYQNATIGAKAEVGDADCPAEALNTLKSLVEAEAFKVGQADRRAYESESLDHSIEQKKYDLRALEERYKRAAEFLSRHGVRIDEDCPF